MIPTGIHLVTLYHPDGRIFTLPPALWVSTKPYTVVHHVPTITIGFGTGWGSVEYRMTGHIVQVCTGATPDPVDPPRDVDYRAMFLVIDDRGEPSSSWIGGQLRLEDVVQGDTFTQRIYTLRINPPPLDLPAA